MECYATPWRLWRESRISFVFTEPSYPENLPSIFVPFLSWRPSLAQNLRYVVCSLSFDQLKGGCVSRTPLSCRKFSLWKIMESLWQEGITRLQVDKVYSLNTWCSLQCSTIFLTHFWFNERLVFVVYGHVDVISRRVGKFQELLRHFTTPDPEAEIVKYVVSKTQNNLKFWFVLVG